MKALAILSVAAATVLTFNVNTAFSQGSSCQQDYSTCMGTCAGKPLKSIQDTCFSNCENTNNVCAERMFGKRPFNGGASSAAEQQGKSTNALARTPTDKAQPQQARQEQAPRGQQQARDEQPQQQDAAPPQAQASPQGQAPQQAMPKSAVPQKSQTRR